MHSLLGQLQHSKQPLLGINKTFHVNSTEWGTQFRERHFHLAIIVSLHQSMSQKSNEVNDENHQN